MREVTKDAFFAALYAECNRGKDIMPNLRGPYPYKSDWKDVRTNATFGMSTDEYVNGVLVRQYFLS